MNKRLLASLLLCSFFVFASATTTAALTAYPISEIIPGDLTLTPAEEETLKRGEVAYRVNTDDLPGGIAMGYVKAAPEKVYHAATTYAEYMEFMPGALKVEVPQVQESTSLVYAEYKSEWPYDKVFIESVNIHDRSNPSNLRMAWKATRSSFKTARGYWIVKPYKEGSLVAYEMGFDLNWIPRPLAKSSGKKRVLEVIQAVMRRAEKI